MSKKDELLKKIKDEVIGCKKCSLSKTRTLPVIGQGDHKAKIMFVGEAPGANEDKTGVPFCGQSGNILTELLNSIGLQRENVYICNILKCRPPENRNPQANEIEACISYLEKQIEVIKPKIIGALGNYAVSHILKKYNLDDQIQGISKMRGKIFKVKVSFGEIKIIPLYHPAVAAYNANMKDILKEDFKILKKYNGK
ncbi:uracil-DNA glycosylase [Patescibacteria group bacterium]|nr:uracil-DNA glycosylase [Patescibacteria group bacterium]